MSDWNRACALSRGARPAAPVCSTRRIAWATYRIWDSIMNTTELCPSAVFGPSRKNRFG
jgi:hypothetical protein